MADYGDDEENDSNVEDDEASHMATSTNGFELQKNNRLPTILSNFSRQADWLCRLIGGASEMTA
jgi:hypothetical protein